MATLEENEYTEVIWEGDNPDPAAETDIDAPYGRKADGTPRKKPGRRAGSTNSGSSSTARTARGKSRLELEIIDAMSGDLAPTIGVISPMAAFVLDERAERTARALNSIANRSPRFKEGLERVIIYKDILGLASLPPALAIAFAVDFGMVRHDSMMARRFNLYEPFIEMYGNQGTETMPDYVVPEPIGLLSDG